MDVYFNTFDEVSNYDGELEIMSWDECVDTFGMKDDFSLNTNVWITKSIVDDYLGMVFASRDVHYHHNGFIDPQKICKIMSTKGIDWTIDCRMVRPAAADNFCVGDINSLIL